MQDFEMLCTTRHRRTLRDVGFFKDKSIPNRHAGRCFSGLSNHLGNVLVTFSDKRLGYCEDDTVYWYRADIRTANDYAAFGAPLDDRQWYSNSDSSSYRFGFNGYERESIGSSGNFTNFNMRMYNNRLGRFFRADFLRLYSYSPYHFAFNSPILLLDKEGLIGETGRFDGRGIYIAANTYVFDRRTPADRAMAGVLLVFADIATFGASGIAKDLYSWSQDVNDVVTDPTPVNPNEVLKGVAQQTPTFWSYQSTILDTYANPLPNGVNKAIKGAGLASTAYDVYKITQIQPVRSEVLEAWTFQIADMMNYGDVNIATDMLYTADKRLMEVRLNRIYFALDQMFSSGVYDLNNPEEVLIAKEILQNNLPALLNSIRNLPIDLNAAGLGSGYSPNYSDYPDQNNMPPSGPSKKREYTYESPDSD